MTRTARIALGAAIFTVSFAYVWWIAGDLFSISADEGIYLEGGRRVARGEWPYRDFFVLTGPLTFWIQGALFRLGGTIAWMRLAMVFDVAFLTWFVFRLVSRFSGAWLAGGTAAAFLVYAAGVNRMVVNHRWDSGALASAAILAALAAHRGRRSLWFACGALAAAAAWATPSVGLVAIPFAIWSFRQTLRAGVAFLSGGAMVTLAGAGALAAGGALRRMIDALLWLGPNYSVANRVTYGAILIELPFTGQGPLHFAMALAVHCYKLIPALIPPVAVALWIWRLRRHDQKDRDELPYLLAAVAALVLACWPRWTNEQLVYVMAPSSAMLAVALQRSLPSTWRAPLFAAFLFAVAAAGINGLSPPFQYLRFPTRAGMMRGDSGDAAYIAAFERRIPAGETMFMFPYEPMMYVLLDGRNPTRYSFLQPGMMSLEDENRAVGELAAHPPHWVLVAEVPQEVIMAVWPGSDPMRIPMEALHTYIRAHYTQVDEIRGKWGSAVVMEAVSPPPPR